MFSFAVPPFHHNYLQQQECDEHVIQNVTNEWGSCIPARVCHFAASFSAEYVPDVACQRYRRHIATPLPILLRVALFLYLLCWC